MAVRMPLAVRRSGFVRQQHKDGCLMAVSLSSRRASGRWISRQQHKDGCLMAVSRTSQSGSDTSRCNNTRTAA